MESVLALRGAQTRISNVELEVHGGAERASVYADPDHLKQVLHNLIGNATQAIQAAHGSGTVRVRIERGDGSVELIVEDTGPGIAEDVRPKIFRPFFTTKEVGERTGLGLAVSLKLVRENGGELTAANWGRPAVEGGRPGEGGARLIASFPDEEKVSLDTLETSGAGEAADRWKSSIPASDTTR